MIHYRDMTFCSATCANHTCPRNFTDEVKLAAREWWGKEGAPVSFADFSEDCGEYEAK